ncbi:hypothetical protein [Streptomyces sp. NBC_01445]|uniref:hypothetical protein n=1 Tax=Streptomyces sp. NBC_01445 TaxID=2903869 RepID=UPI002DDB19E3|nr:hypothetical protein [Streptomyces sp. NBC_01445]WSE03836.1 hypothetical protein OG574_10905 [Streptomyces sp. NBC_01445]
MTAQYNLEYEETTEEVEEPDDALDADEETEQDSAAIWSRFGDTDLPALPKKVAVIRAARAGEESGLPSEFATALAHAAVDPSELRILLRRPTRVNIAGGVIEAIDLDLYVPGLVPLPTNNRTMEKRVYPAAGAEGFSGPLTGPRSAPGETTTLWIEGEDVSHVQDETERAREFILANNNLRESIAARGIAMPVNVVFFELGHRDGEPSMPLLGTADGSSRITNAHQVLGLTDPQTHYHFPTSRNDYRRFIGSISEADPAALRPAARRRLIRQRNALITPARVFLRFTPTRQGYDYARAVNAFVGMLHVDPPRPWSQTGKLEAMAEAVLEVLRGADVLDDPVHDYLAGLLTPEQAEDKGLPVERDEQAAFVLAALLREHHRGLVERGIRDVTAKKSVSTGRRTDVIAELALRPTRSVATTLEATDAERQRSERMRAAYLRCARLPRFGTAEWKVTGRSPEELLEAALAELRGDPRGSHPDPVRWVNRLELAAVAQYHLTAWGGLRREAMGNTGADKRGPQQILEAMLRDEQGLRLLAQAIVDGRDGTYPRRVTESGDFQRGVRDEYGNWHEDPKGKPMPIEDEWLRYEVYATGTTLPRPVTPPNETPRMKATRLKSQIIQYVEQINLDVDELANVEEAQGGPLLDKEGWAKPNELLSHLMNAHSQISYWARVAERQMARSNG